MTTIAWDGKLLAGDKQCSFGNTPLGCTKVFRADGLIWGCCGDLEDTVLFGRWIYEGCPKDNKPELADNFTAIVIELGQCWQYNPKLVPLKVESRLWACGSGADYALGAMAMGADARHAVEVAIEFDIYSGIGVDTVVSD